jgi:NitT/TauT family transport system substrate-binding protein
VVAYLRAAIEADGLLAAEPEKYSELIAQVTGIEAAVLTRQALTLFAQLQR